MSRVPPACLDLLNLVNLVNPVNPSGKPKERATKRKRSLVSTEQISALDEPTQATATARDVWFRLLGVLPLVFFMGQAVHYWRYGGFGNMLWMCNIGNLLLAIGLFIGQRELIRVGAIWMIPGLGIWIRYVLFEYGFLLTSTLAHVGGFA